MERTLNKLTQFVLRSLIISVTIFSTATLRASDKIGLRMQTLPGPMGNDVNSQATRAVVREFQQRFPQYALTPFQFPALREGGMDEGPLMAIATGNPPHGIYVNFRQSSTYINHGFLAPLEVLLARLKSDNPATREADAQGRWLADPSPAEIAAALEEIRARVVRSAWQVVYRKADTNRDGVPKGEHVWSMPYGTLVQALVYRKDIFNEAGLNPEHPPRDWDTFMEYSRKIRALPGKYGFMFSTGPYVSYSVTNFMAANNVVYMDQSADGKWQAAFGTAEAAEAVYFVLRLAREQFEIDGETYTGAAFAPLGGGREMGMKWENGEIGMRFMDLSFERGTIDPALHGVAPVPSPPGGRAAAGQLNCTMLGVFSGSSPEQQLGVMRYIWFLTGEDARRIRTQIFVDNGYGRFLDPADLEAFGYTDVLREVPEDWKRTLELSFESGVPEPYGRNTQLIYQYVSEPINWAVGNPALLELPEEEALQRIQERLEAAATRTDKFMIGELSPEEWRIRRTVGGLGLLLIITIFTTAVSWVWRGFTAEERKLPTRRKLRKFTYAYLLILPGLALVVFNSYLPLALGVPIALLDFQLVLQSAWVGLDNFATILYDLRFWRSLANTLYYVLLVVGLGFWPPILVAILLSEVPTDTLKYIFRTIFYLPTIVSGIIMVFLWRQLYDPTETGFLNQIIMSVNYLGPVSATLLKFVLLGCWLSLVAFIFACAVKLTELSWPVRSAVALFSLALLGATFYRLVAAYIGPDELVIAARGLNPAEVSGWGGVWSYITGFFGRFDVNPLGWIEDPGMAMISCVIPMIWASAGPGCIIYLAALKTVPEELVEAATIDGASLLQKISYITLPRIKFLILIQLLGAIVGSFKGGTNFILVMTGGGPNGATRTMGLDIFERAWMELRFSEGAAMGWILGAIVVIMTCYQLRRMSRATFTTAAQAETAKQNRA